MLEVKLEKCLVTPQELVLGLVIHGPKQSWVRFAQARIPLRLIPWEAVVLAVSALDDPPTEELDDVPLF